MDDRPANAAPSQPAFRARARVRVPFVRDWTFLLAATICLALVGTVFVATVAAIPAFFAALVMLAMASDKLSPLTDVTLDGDTLRIGERAVPVASIRRALQVPTKDRDFVRLERRGRPGIDLAFERVWQGDELLRAMGLDPTQRAVDFYLRSPARDGWRGWLAFGLVLFVGVAAVAAAHLSALGSLVWGLALAALLSPCRVRVGVDGVERLWLGVRRMIRVAAIRDVTVHADQVLPGARQIVHRVDLHLADASTFSLATSSEEKAAIVAERVRRIVHAHARAREGESSERVDLVNALARGPRTARDWIAHLQALTQHGAGAGYRNAAVERTDLVRVAENPELAAPTRLAAAVALAATADETERKRIADLGAASADPRVRDGMIRIANATDDAALEESLFAAEEEAHARSRG